VDACFFHNRRDHALLALFGKVQYSFFGQLCLLFDDAETVIKRGRACGRRRLKHGTKFVIVPNQGLEDLARDMIWGQIPH
jgi:hypothetical protein